MHSDSRRKFLVSCLGGITATLAAIFLWPVWRYLAPRGGLGKGEKTEVARNRVPVGGVFFFQHQGHPAVVLQRAPGVFVAFSAICTHLGCIIQWLPQNGEFLCPCHAGRYASDGRVLSGPPPKPLQTIPVTVSVDNLLIG